MNISSISSQVNAFSTLKQLIYLCLVLVFIPYSNLTAQNNQNMDTKLTIELSNLRNTKGQILVSVFDSPEGFPDDTKKAAKLLTFDLRENPENITITGLQPGKYAICLVHDEDRNGKLRTNFMGIPKEGIGVSNNSLKEFGAPEFEASQFKLSHDNKTLKLRIRYY